MLDNILVICTHSLNTDCDIEILNREFKDENEWIKRDNGILCLDEQLWKRDNFDTWSFFKLPAFKYSTNISSKDSFPPYRSEIIMFYKNEDLKNGICIMSYTCRNLEDSKILKDKKSMNIFNLILNTDIFSNRLDLLLLDKELSKLFPELWAKWS